jgi:MSHA pilin protein MshA
MKKQSGFTLIELVVVMVILGILAAVALPKFVDMSTQARMAKMNGGLGSVKSAAALIHAQWLATGSPTATVAGTTVKYEGGTLDVFSDMAYGYPNGTSIVTVAGLDSSYATTTSATSATVTDTTKTTCQFVYTAPTATGGAPTYTTSGISSTNC